MEFFPLTWEQVRTVGGLALVVAVLVELAKPYIRHWGADLWVNLAALVVAWAISFLGTCIFRGTGAEALFEAFLLGVGGAAGATLGYEVVKNLAQFVSQIREG